MGKTVSRARPVGVPVGTRIRQRRQELGLSIRDLAVPGVSDTHISRIELGKRNPSIRCLRKLAERLGVSTYWLETGERDPAEELARLVLDREAALPPEAVRLARLVLGIQPINGGGPLRPV